MKTLNTTEIHAISGGAPIDSAEVPALIMAGIGFAEVTRRQLGSGLNPTLSLLAIATSGWLGAYVTHKAIEYSSGE